MLHEAAAVQQDVQRLQHVRRVRGAVVGVVQVALLDVAQVPGGQAGRGVVAATATNASARHLLCGTARRGRFVCVRSSKSSYCARVPRHLPFSLQPG